MESTSSSSTTNVVVAGSSSSTAAAAAEEANVKKVGEKEAVKKKETFLSAQKRYDNRRVRESELNNKRLCYECGRISISDREYQAHILCHEAMYLAVGIYHVGERPDAVLARVQSLRPPKGAAQQQKPIEGSSTRARISRGGGAGGKGQQQPKRPPVKRRKLSTGAEQQQHQKNHQQ